MQRKNLRFPAGFRVGLGNRRSQSATLVIRPGKSEGGPDNRHRGADQWLYVAAGEGEARIDGRRYALRPGTLLLIEKGDRHGVYVKTELGVFVFSMNPVEGDAEEEALAALVNSVDFDVK